MVGGSKLDVWVLGTEPRLLKDHLGLNGCAISWVQNGVWIACHT